MHVLLWVLGVSPDPQGTSPWYQLWSGIVPSLVILGAALRWLRGQNCHVKGCWRIGRYEAGQFRVCWRHHPSDSPPARHVTVANVREAWHAARERERDVLGRLVASARADWEAAHHRPHPDSAGPAEPPLPGRDV